MDDPIEEYEHNGHKIRIYFDFDPINPRTEWDNAGVMVFRNHDRYILGDKYDDHGYRYENYDSWEEMCDEIMDDEQAIVILPLHAYGCERSRFSIGTGDPSFLRGWYLGWDEDGIDGVMFIRLKTVHENWGKDITKDTLNKVVGYLRGEVETYNQYLSGEIFGYVVGNEEDDDIESCWGFYGIDHCKEEAENLVDYLIEKAEKEKAETARRVTVATRDCTP